MAQNPVLNLAQCSAAGAAYNVRVSWQHIDGQTYFVAAVFDPNNVVVSQSTVDGSGGTTVASLMAVPLLATTNYTVRVAQSDSSGNPTSSYSQPLTVLQGALTNISTVNDFDSLTISATLPTAGPATGIVVSLYDDADNLLVTDLIDGSSGVVTPPTPLDPAGSYYTYVQPGADSGLSTGGPQRIDLTMAQPQVSAISYDGANMTVSTATTLPNGAGLDGLFLANDQVAMQQTGGAVSVSFAVNMSTLDMSKAYACALRAVINGSAGPRSASVPAVVTPPQLTSAYYVAGHVGAAWTVPPVGPAPTGAQLVAILDGAPFGDPKITLGYLGDVDLSGTVPATSLKVQVNSVFGVAKGPPASIDLPIAKPVVSSASLTAQGVESAWGAAVGAPGYRLSLNDSTGKSIASLETVDVLGAMSAPINPAAAYSLSVQPYGATAGGIKIFGPFSDSVALLAGTPVVTSTAYDGAKVTVTWTAPSQVAGVTGYTALLLDPDTLQPTGDQATAAAGDTTATINAVLASGQSVAAAVRAVGDKTSGLLGPMVQVITALPRITTCEVSAASIDLAWSSPSRPGVTGYEVTISDDAQTPTTTRWKTTDTRLSTANTLAASQVNVRVQAKGPSATGPVAAAVNLFGASPSFYPQPVSLSDTRPYLIRAASNQPSAVAITFALPDVFTAAPATLPSAGIFALQANASSTLFPYKVVVAANSVAWAFDAASRTTLAADFLAFLKVMEKPDGTHVLIKPGALTMIRQSLALGLPLLFSEQLGFMYGFNPDADHGGFVDLVPGMRLRVEGEIQQSTPPSNNQTGYVPGGTSIYDIQSYVQGQQLNTGFNAYLSLLGRPKMPSPLSQPNAGGAGVIDLYAPTGRKPYYRLLYPSAMRDPKFAGLVDQSSLPVILGAFDYNTLVAATDQYVIQGNFSGYDVYPFYFRGRAVVTPEISVRLNGRVCWMTLGSTAADLLTQQGALPCFVNAAVDGFSMRRSIGGLSSDLAATAISTSVITANRVRLDYPAATFSAIQPGYFGLPLFGGDDLRLEADGAD